MRAGGPPRKVLPGSSFNIILFRDMWQNEGSQRVPTHTRTAELLLAGRWQNAVARLDRGCLSCLVPTTIGSYHVTARHAKIPGGSLQCSAAHIGCQRAASGFTHRMFNSCTSGWTRRGGVRDVPAQGIDDTLICPRHDWYRGHRLRDTCCLLARGASALHM